MLPKILDLVKEGLKSLQIFLWHPGTSWSLRTFTFCKKITPFKFLNYLKSGKLIKKETKLGLDKKQSYLGFTDNVNKIKNDLINLLIKLKNDGKKVVAYGATSKSTTVTNYFGINSELVQCIFDTTPIKQNKFSGSFGQSVLCPTKKGDMVALLGLGDESSRKKSRFALAAAAKSLPAGAHLSA